MPFHNYILSLLFRFAIRQSGGAHIRCIWHDPIYTITGMQSCVCTSIADKSNPVCIVLAEALFLMLCVLVSHSGFIARSETFVG